MKSLLTTWDSPLHGKLTIHYNWLRSSERMNKGAKMMTAVAAQARYRELREKAKENNGPWVYPDVREDEG